MKNLRELFTLYPLDCESYGAEWLRRWEGIGRLLQKPAGVMVFDNGQWWSIRHGTAQTCIVYCSKKHHNERRRVALLDGTVVYEWGPK